MPPGGVCRHAGHCSNEHRPRVTQKQIFNFLNLKSGPAQQVSAVLNSTGVEQQETLNPSLNLKLNRSSRRGAAETNLTRNHEVAGLIPGLSSAGYGSCVAVAVV